MDGSRINKSIKKISILFAVFYSMVWLASGFIINSFDQIHGLVTGAQIVDSWSLGIMFWFGLVFTIPALYLLIMAYLIFKKYAVNKGNN